MEPRKDMYDPSAPVVSFADFCKSFGKAMVEEAPGEFGAGVTEQPVSHSDRKPERPEAHDDIESNR